MYPTYLHEYIYTLPMCIQQSSLAPDYTTVTFTALKTAKQANSPYPFVKEIKIQDFHFENYEFLIIRYMLYMIAS